MTTHSVGLRGRSTATWFRMAMVKSSCGQLPAGAVQPHGLSPVPPHSPVGTTGCGSIGQTSLSPWAHLKMGKKLWLSVEAVRGAGLAGRNSEAKAVVHNVLTCTGKCEGWLLALKFPSIFTSGWVCQYWKFLWATTWSRYFGSPIWIIPSQQLLVKACLPPPLCFLLCQASCKGICKKPHRHRWDPRNCVY